MFGMRHYDSDHSHCAGGRHGRGWRGRHGFGGRHGRHGMDGDDDMMRAGRMLAQGDLRLIALALIAEQPRHGYEIIKLLDERTSGWYSPSPGIVYPTLTFLEEVGYLTAQAEGAKRLYTITDEGRAHLKENRDLADAVLRRLTRIGERAARWRRASGEERDDRRPVPQLVRAALVNLRDAAVKVIEENPEAEARVVELLARAAIDLQRK
jgi:DNA-binding PadR family transcriptional regulator